jgi:2-C-methyl-D-erythritol 4-phosphate cytidylyltransferase/2-C-methyl-D-erythritol 2,4-cyclodiphosphate synthase
MSAAGPRVAVIIVAAGEGARLGADVPKAFVRVGSRTLLEHAVHSVLGMSEPAQLIVAAPPALIADAGEMAEAAAGVARDLVSIVPGGASRQASVAAALGALAPEITVVLVHDAARAFTPPAQFERVVAAVDATGRGAVPGLPVSDTIKRVADDATILETVDRAELAAVQTPQGFPRDQLEQAYAAAQSEVTDDAALVDHVGHAVSIVPGDPMAFKITTPWDLQRARHLIEPASAPAAPRIGLGTDTHAFGGTNALWLAGLEWPGEQGLAGHSDGDVVAHAMTDALLSAAGLGDIGTVFGTSDPAFAGAHGDVFLTETLRRVESAGFSVGNVAVQLIGNRPRLGERRAEAEERLSALLRAPVSLSATTTDGLGFAGRGDGVTAVATALLLPNKLER